MALVQVFRGFAKEVDESNPNMKDWKNMAYDTWLFFSFVGLYIVWTDIF